MTTIDSDIEDITRTIWTTLFDLDLELGGVSLPGPESTVTSCVQIDGDWHGALVLQCPLELGRSLATAMFQGDSEPDVGQVRDALGELANMTGGNVKAVLPGSCRVSLPAVVVGSDYDLSIVGTSTVSAVSFICNGHPLLVTLFKRSDATDSAVTAIATEAGSQFGSGAER